MIQPMYAPPPVLASRQVRGLFNQTAAWMRAQGYEVPDAQVSVSPTVMGQVGGRGARREGVAISGEGGITLSARGLPDIAALARAVYGHPAAARRGSILSDLPYSPYDAMTVMHELGHGRTQNEGMVEATAADLLPAWWARFMHGKAKPAGLTFGDAVVRFRKASATATGEPWTSTDARAWRRARVNASQP